MSMSIPVQHYQVHYHSSRSAQRLEESIRIDLYHDQKKYGVIYFYPEDTERRLRDRVFAQSEHPVIYLEYYDRHYERVIDLLRNETVGISINVPPGAIGSFTTGDGEITTGKEPVGEGEAS